MKRMIPVIVALFGMLMIAADSTHKTYRSPIDMLNAIPASIIPKELDGNSQVMNPLNEWFQKNVVGSTLNGVKSEQKPIFRSRNGINFSLYFVNAGSSNIVDGVKLRFAGGSYEATITMNK